MYGDFKANNYFSLIISCEHIWTNVGNSSKDNNNNDDGLQFFLVFLLRTYYTNADYPGNGSYVWEVKCFMLIFYIGITQ